MNDSTIFTISICLILSLLIGCLAEKRKIGFLWGFLLSFFFESTYRIDNNSLFKKEK